MTGLALSAAISAAATFAVVLPGLVLLRRLRRRAFAVLIVVAVLLSVAAVTSGVAVSGIVMFDSAHDVTLLLPMLVVAVSAAVLTGLLLARWLDSARRRLEVAVQERDTVALATLPGPAEMRALGSALLATETTRRELVAWISHDLRTPLAGLRRMTEALGDKVVTDEETVEQYHANMRRELDRLAGLVDDLFELSRLQAGIVSRVLTRVDPADLISDAVASADPLASERAVRLVATSEGLPPVRVDVSEFNRALGNLLLNAIQHTPSDGSVEVVGRHDERSVFLDVHDTCGGILAADLPRVFDTAFRGHDARTPGEDSGAGLGLAIAKSIVGAHGGDISVANDGVGCRFVIRLPVAV